MAMKRIKVGNLQFDKYYLYNWNGRTEKFYKRPEDVYNRGTTMVGKTYIAYLNDRKNLEVYSPEEYPKFTFFIGIKNGFPVFLQIAPGFAMITAGVLFARKTGPLPKMGYVYMKKKKDGLYEVMLNIGIEELRGKYYTDGERLWKSVYGKDVERIRDLITWYHGDFVFLAHNAWFVEYDGKQYYSNYNNIYREVPSQLIEKRNKVDIDGVDYWVPRYYVEGIFPNMESWRWRKW